MGLFNTVHVEMHCPRCQQTSVMPVEVKFGWLNQLDYHLQDEVQWSHKDVATAENRPPAGTGEFEGYCECPKCQKDFWVRIQVTHDRIQKVNLDLTRPGFVM
jgi:hypothetical protein